MLTSKTDGVELHGDLISFEDGIFRIETVIGEIAISGDQVECAGPGCPDAAPQFSELRATPGEQVTVITGNNSISLNGTLVSFEDGKYTIETNIGRLEIVAEGTRCEGPGCPVPVGFQGAVDVVGTPAAATVSAQDPAAAALLPAISDFSVPLARLSTEPTLEIAGAASVIETLLPQIAASIADGSGLTAELADTVTTPFAAAAGQGLPAGSLGLEITGAEGTQQTVLARLTSGGGASGNADLTVLTSTSDTVPQGNNVRELGLEAMVPIVSSLNPVFAISPEDLAAVFAGTITDWSQIGGQSGPIRVLALAPPHDLTAATQSQVLDPFGLSLSPDVERLATTAEIRDAVAEDTSAIAFVGAAQQGDVKALGIFDTCGIAVAATPAAVKGSRYPYVRHIFVDARTTNGLAETLLASLEGASGLIAPGLSIHALDDEIGQVRDSLNRIEDRIARQNASNALRMMAGARKLSISVDFDGDSSQIADSAHEDFRTFLSYVKARGALNEIFLVGFSEETGDLERNHDIGRSAAQLVASKLSELDQDDVLGDVLVRTIGLGAIIPRTCVEDRVFENRRVEFWIRG